ncbi:hypothetical protein Bealeia2_02069 (plasmid) [Candidatus Bealeia paramacronuclearis]|nr:hypothetical protein [Candidatus Bealeia paramacronuclearis]
MRDLHFTTDLKVLHDTFLFGCLLGARACRFNLCLPREIQTLPKCVIITNPVPVHRSKFKNVLKNSLIWKFRCLNPEFLKALPF